MGAAQEYRYKALVRQQLERTARPVEFKFMDHLNSLPKYPDAGTPFGPLRFVESKGYWWAECPKTGFGYPYKSLREAVRRWNVSVVSWDGQAWIAEVNR